MDGSVRMAIGALAKQTGTNVETVRFYERIGLLAAPTRSSGGYRQYQTQHVKRLSFVRRARALGFSIDEIRTLLRLGRHEESLSRLERGMDRNLLDWRTVA